MKFIDYNGDSLLIDTNVISQYWQQLEQNIVANKLMLG